MNLPGKGIQCRVEGVGDVQVGSFDFVGLKNFDTVSTWARGWQSDGCVVVALAVDGHTVAAFALRDELQEKAEVLVRTLQKRGIEVWMCTGDQRETALAIARRVGIPESQVRASCLPATKAEVVET